jgi:hypothetical protein
MGGRAYVGDTFPYRGLQREQQGQYHYHQRSLEEQERYQSPSPAAIQDQHPPDVLLYPTYRTFQSQSMNTTDEETTMNTTLSDETRLKIAELKRLIYRYSQNRNPDAFVNCIVYYCNNGDNSLLDEKLEQLRTFDRTM